MFVDFGTTVLFYGCFVASALGENGGSALPIIIVVIFSPNDETTYKTIILP